MVSPDVVGLALNVPKLLVEQNQELPRGLVYYVVRLDVEQRQVVVGPKELLATRQVPIKEINWLGDAFFTSEDVWQLDVKVRSTRPPREALIRPLSETDAIVELTVAEEGVSPGQACVFYSPDTSRIFGGGWIHKGR